MIGLLLVALLGGYGPIGDIQASGGGTSQGGASAGQASAGSSSAPAYSFASDPNSGLFLQNPNSLGLSANGNTLLALNGAETFGAAVVLGGSGATYFDGNSPLLRIGSAGLLSYPDALQVRNAAGDTNWPLKAQWLYATGFDANGDGLISISGNVRAGQLRSYRFTNSSRITDVSDGTIALSNNAGTAFSALRLGSAGNPNTPSLSVVTGAPNGALTANPGSLALNRNGGAPYYKDTGTGNTGWLLLPTSRSALGQNDASDLTSVYEVEECLGATNQYTQATSGTGAAAGQNNITNPASEILTQHPGVLVAQTGAVGYAGVYALKFWITSKASGVTNVWRGLFRMPDVISSAADRYVYSVGSLVISGSSITSGAYISYSHDLNGGNWTCNTNYTTVETINTTNSTTAAPAPGTWHTLQVTNVGGSAVFSFVLDGVALCSVTDAGQNTGQVVQHSLGGIHLSRTASSASAVYTALFDRGSLYMTNLPR